MVRVYVPVELARRVREAARDRCGYCLSPQHLILGRLQIEHLVTRARGGRTEEDNLWLSCPLCNNYKGDRITATDPETGETCPLFNPRAQTWSEHFRWNEDALRIIGLTPIGRATVAALHLSDDPDALTVRSYWVLAGWHPPRD
jgi:HNH endonuclease